MSVSAEEREDLPLSEFGLPKERKYLIDSPERARSALAYIKREGTPTQIKQVQHRVAAKYPSMSVQETGK